MSGYANGDNISAKHPRVHGFLHSVLPATHPDVDEMLRNPTQNPLPAWHPAIPKFQRRQDEVKPVVPVSIGHPNTTAMYAAGHAVPASHPAVHPLVSPWLPATHPVVDDMLKDPAAHTLPSWHPRLEDLLVRLGTVASNLMYVFPEQQSVPWWHPHVSEAYVNHT